MSVLVDSSVWIDYLNGFACPEAEALDQLLKTGDVVTCGLVAVEVFQGLRRDRERDRLERRFRSLTCLETEGLGLYLAAAELYRALRARGITIRSSIDCILVALAESHDCTLLARDRDMTVLLASGLVRVRAWPA